MRGLAYILLTATALFWAGNAIAGKLAVGHISPLTLTALRWAVALSILVAISVPQLRRDWPAIRRHALALFLYGATGFALFNIGFYTALLYTSAINSAIVQSAMPIFVFAANFVLIGQRVGGGQILGFLLSAAGVIVTVAKGDLMALLALDVNRGDLIMLAAIAVYGGYTVALRWKPALHWKSLMGAMATGALLASLPFAFWELASGHGIWPDGRGWAVTLYTAIGPSILAQVFFMRGVELIGANRAGLFINLVPVFAAVLAIVILGESFHTFHAVAMVMVVGGIWIAERSGRRIGTR